MPGPVRGIVRAVYGTELEFWRASWPSLRPGICYLIFSTFMSPLPPSLPTGSAMEGSLGPTHTGCLQLRLSGATTHQGAPCRPGPVQPDPPWPHPSVHHGPAPRLLRPGACPRPSHPVLLEAASGKSASDQGEACQRVECLRARTGADEQS